MSSDEMKRTNRKRRLRIGLIVVLVLIVALLISGFLIYRRLIVKPDLPLPDKTITPPVVTIDPVTGEEQIDPVVVEKVDGDRKSEDFYTILVVGTDTSSSSTDTMMLVSYNVTMQNATVMAIPRDTLVNTFGTDRHTRINSIYAAYGRGERGMNALTYEISELVGFIPDYQVFINWELVGQIVDSIGGVQYDVPFHMEYDDPAQDLHIYVEKGLQTLDGDKAMQMVRWRKNNAGVSSGGGTGSDLDRVKVQQGFLKAILKEMLQIKTVTRINELAKMFSENVEGNLSMENVLWFATQAIFGGLSVDAVEFTTMPWKAANPYIYPDQEKLLELINTKLNPFKTDITLNQLDLIYFDAEGNMCATGNLSN